MGKAWINIVHYVDEETGETIKKEDTKKEYKITKTKIEINYKGRENRRTRYCLCSRRESGRQEHERQLRLFESRENSANNNNT